MIKKLFIGILLLSVAYPAQGMLRMVFCGQRTNRVFSKKMIPAVVKPLRVFSKCFFSMNNRNSLLLHLPSKEVLTERLRKLGHDHFIEKTDIITILGGQPKYAVGVVMAVELALCDYNEHMQNSVLARIMHMSKPRIIQAILKDYPQEIEQLKEDGLLE